MLSHWSMQISHKTLDHLEDNIRRVIADIRPQMLEKVIENWTSRLDYIRASRGSPMPEIIFKIPSPSFSSYLTSFGSGWFLVLTLFPLYLFFGQSFHYPPPMDPPCGRGSLVVKVTDLWPACHEFELRTTEDPPCRGAKHVRSVEVSNVLLLCLSPPHAYTMGVKYMTGWVSTSGTVGSNLKFETQTGAKILWI
ncbi:hypothetical protein TNCV_3569501 [Trichonephila clavipes]|nr:hypothetical protein TNCV_3569501 [Trichonephila clavipes]